MAVIRNADSASFYVLDKSISENYRLSWGARGLLIYMLGMPDGWELSIDDLVDQTVHSARASDRDEVNELLLELVATGYLKVRIGGNGIDWETCELSEVSR